MTTEIKIIAILGLLIAILAGLWWYGEHRYTLGLNAGKAEVQSAWDTDKANIQKVTDAAIADANAKKEMAEKANEDITRDYEAKLSANRASSDALAASLRDTRTRLAASLGALSKAANNPGASTGSAPPGVGSLDAATAAALTECQAVRAGYIALIAQVKPQL